MLRFTVAVGLLVQLLFQLVVHPPAAAQQFAIDPMQGLPTTGRPSDLVFIDTDGDGDLDVVLAINGGQNRLLENDGHGTFVDATAKLPVDTDASVAVAAGDIDGDGDADLVFGTIFGQNRVYVNNGGVFTDQTSTRIPMRIDGTQAVALVDVNGNGHRDLLIGNQNDVNRLMLNNGAGVFTDVTAANMPNDADNTHAIVATDVEGDLDLDLVIGNDRNGNHLLINDGNGSYTRAPSSRFPSSGDATFAVAAADVTGDGRDDIVFANGLGLNRLYVNRGNGFFDDRSTNLPTNNNSASFAIALVDVDGDGDRDAAIGNSFAQDELWLNDGTGRFSDATARLPAVANGTTSVALADVDQDADADLVFGTTGGAVLYSNRLGHLTAATAPRVGQPWTIDLYHEAGFATAPGFGLPVLALGSRTPALPLAGFGNLLIALNAPLVLPTIPLAAPSGQGSLQIAVPNQPSLANVRVSVQALVGGTGRLTNAISTLIQP